MRWADASSKAMIFARSLHKKLNVPVASPIDIFDVVRSSGLVLAFRPMSSKVSATLVREGGIAGIIINANHPLSRQRFSAAHEFGHYEFGHKSVVDCGEDLFRHGLVLNDQEKLAESFAAWFLMPYPLVLSTVRQAGIMKVTTATEVYQISLRLGTSLSATAFQLRNQKFLSPEAFDEIASAIPAKIKRSLLPDDSLANTRNDVWMVDEHDNGREYIGRSGDRVVVALDEIPTSGRSWIQERQAGPMVVLRSDKYESTEVEGDCIAGGSVRRRFEFEIAGPEEGTERASLVLRNATPWREDPREQRHLSLAFQVEPPHVGFDPALFAVAG
jgi:Zn-dependent peptidase ImmA (M78 family)